MRILPFMKPKKGVTLAGVDYNDDSGGGGGGYTLPPATESTLGGIKVGNGLSIESDGTLSSSGGGGSADVVTEVTLNNVTQSSYTISSKKCFKNNKVCTITLDILCNSSPTNDDAKVLSGAPIPKDGASVYNNAFPLTSSSGSTHVTIDANGDVLMRFGSSYVHYYFTLTYICE